MKKLSCPSCGANLELPETLNFANCIYCGGKIILREEEALDEIVNLDRYIELAHLALESNNYNDALKYSDKILEIDTKNVDAWIVKAESVFMQTTAADDKYETALKYLEIASKIDPVDNRIQSAREKINAHYVHFQNDLGIENLNIARKIFNTYNHTYSTSLLVNAAAIQTGKNESIGYFDKAMNHFLTASSIDIMEITILENIEILYNETNSWIDWTKKPVVSKRLSHLRSIKNKEFAMKKIPMIESELVNIKSSLQKLTGKSGFFDKINSNNLSNKISSLENELHRLRKMAALDLNE